MNIEVPVKFTERKRGTKAKLKEAYLLDAKKNFVARSGERQSPSYAADIKKLAVMINNLEITTKLQARLWVLKNTFTD